MPSIASIISGLLAALAHGLPTNSTIQCTALSALLPNEVSYPVSVTYTSSISSYFWGQGKLAPACIFTPKSASDVSIAIATLSQIHNANAGDSLFAIRSGGHSPVSGAANGNGGVTIDMRSMNSINVSSDQSVVTVGAGTIWDQVYEKLDPMNLTVAGARVAGLGVGGFLTGGGISYFSPEVGWACDRLVGIEVVLANGNIVYATKSVFSDLFVALKGGSNNFGVVTRFDLETISIGNFLGGVVVYPVSTLATQQAAFMKFMDPSNFDPHAAVIQAYVYDGPAEGVLVSNDMEYTLPSISTPPALSEFLSIQPLYLNTMRQGPQLDFVTEQAEYQPTNARGMFINTVFSPTLAVYQEIFSLWNQTVPQVSAVTDLGYNLVFQRIPSTVPGADNSLGLPANSGSLVLLQLSNSWGLATDDALMTGVATQLIADIEKATKAAGVYNRFQYLNYAAQSQTPLDNYGAASKSNLVAVSKKYDPQGLFQTGVPGGFKLSQ